MNKRKNTNTITIKELPKWRAERVPLVTGKRKYNIYNSRNEYLATYHTYNQSVYIRHNGFNDRGSDIGAGCERTCRNITEAMKWVYLKTQKLKSIKR